MCLTSLLYKDPEDRFSVKIYANHFAPTFGVKLIDKYRQLDERVGQMIDFVLHWAKCKGILNPSEGYLSSYALCLIVIFFLQIQINCVVPSIQLCTREITGKEKNMEIPSFGKFLAPSLDERYDNTEEGRLKEEKVEFTTFDFNFNSMDTKKIKKHLNLPKNNETISELITKFFYYFGFDYPVSVYLLG